MDCGSTLLFDNLVTAPIVANVGVSLNPVMQYRYNYSGKVWQASRFASCTGCKPGSLPHFPGIVVPVLHYRIKAHAYIRHYWGGYQIVKEQCRTAIHRLRRESLGKVSTTVNP